MDPPSPAVRESDPYREIELYLEKVQEEIGDVFEHWQDVEPAAPKPAPSPEAEAQLQSQPDCDTEPPQQPPADAGPVPAADPEPEPEPERAAASTQVRDGERRRRPRFRRPAKPADERDAGDCPQPLAEFDAVVARELSALRLGAVDAGTQTSPTLSRSSSLTSDWSLALPCSRSSASSTASCCESGLGTASPRLAATQLWSEHEGAQCRSADDLLLSKVQVAPGPLSASATKCSSAPLLAGSQNSTLKKSRHERHIPEIESAEACKWLRAAGFPQYAQMYEDGHFPIDLNSVHRDHPFLDADSLKSLFRRLHTLNRSAAIRVDKTKHTHTHTHARGRTRTSGGHVSADDSEEELECALSEQWTFQARSRRWSRLDDASAAGVDQDTLRVPSQSSVHDQERDHDRDASPGSSAAASAADAPASPSVRRSGSERLKDSARALLKRVDSLKARRRKRLHREAAVVQGPQLEVSLSDSEVGPTSWRAQHDKVLELLDADSKGSQDEDLNRPSASANLRAQLRGGSLRHQTPVHHSFHKAESFAAGGSESALSASLDSHESTSTLADSDRDEADASPRHRCVRWHSFRRAGLTAAAVAAAAAAAGWERDKEERRAQRQRQRRQLGALSAGQMLVLRKLALLKLTACMEKYCPTHRSGWNWELPKFIRKIKTPDYKDKSVFGVPLVVSVQRSGQALPRCIQIALRWLENNALDQVGLFRKSGVRSRIHKLKIMTETHGDLVSYEGQQAYDVADMVKQYFRELPDPLMTNKLSETFISIFQHVSVASLRAEAVRCALLLLPDEHREALQALLWLLSCVAQHSSVNQMTASNIAVCLAPSIFQLQPELAENRAAHDCLLYLITEHKHLFTVTDEMLSQCHFNYMEESVPVTMEELGSDMHQDWRGYLYACTTALLKEARDRSRGWIFVPCTADTLVEMSYKKVGDGHPLRLWRVSTEVEAPPQELLQRVLRERHMWDHSLLKWRVVAKPDTRGEVFQYVCSSMAPLPSKDYCVLRSWRTDLPKGACIIVETSVEHAEAPIMPGAVRGIVLASRYLIEPCGSGKSRIIHLSRVDTKGRTPDWYNKSYGHICAMYLTHIRCSFKHNSDGPESKV
ncbi:stAR-related lipid transfer protein 13 [Schistocerca cancellata]|uniref:stAR-related lipid transfer protein 13 n=1 Tax=Schistocerca cancellata TaxID=274614 RepID=UPI0021196791|nr:stAR-related lipid transfer protein 13 [Schistocerca cancellata]